MCFEWPGLTLADLAGGAREGASRAERGATCNGTSLVAFSGLCSSGCTRSAVLRVDPVKGLRRGEGRSALVVRDEVVKLDLGTAKDVECRAIREVDFAVRESFDESEVVGAWRGRERPWSEESFRERYSGRLRES